MSDRIEQLHAWLGGLLGQADYRLAPASADASARRYWRLYLGADSRIVMDAPPPEDCTRFVRLAQRLRASGLRTPAIHAASLEQGFLLLDDLGDRTYLGALGPATANALYQDAIEALLRWQSRDAGADLPPYDAALLARELAIFRDWFLEGLLGLRLSAAEQALLDDAERLLIASALEQPRVCVHRDYHSRNLMRLDTENPGILDFQDAV
ncbi:MAG: phosphotransferase, partial [Chromatiaceae bacterium]|nr:phosphotransferase [Chromatiaceae bacterium]